MGRHTLKRFTDRKAVDLFFGGQKPMLAAAVGSGIGSPFKCNTAFRWPRYRLPLPAIRPIQIAARQLGTPLCNDSGKKDRYQEKPKHVADKMWNEADQAVAGLAIQNRKKNRIDKDTA